MTINHWDEYQASREQRFAYIRAKTLRPKPCPTCGLHLCICQSVLSDTPDEPPIKLTGQLKITDFIIEPF